MSLRSRIAGIMAVLGLALLLSQLVAPAPAPTPDPSPVVAPIAGDGLRVILLDDREHPERLTAQQRAAFTAGAVREYLATHCVKEADGRAGWRLYDVADDVTPDGEPWASAMKRPRQSGAWLIASNGKTGIEQTFRDADDLLALLKKVGGP